MRYFTILDALIKLVLYVGMVSSILFLFRSALKSGWSYARYTLLGYAHRRRLRQAYYARQQTQGIRKPAFRWSRHLADLLEATVVRDVSTANTIQNFYYVSVGSSALSYILFYFLTDNFLTPMPLAIVILFLPYVGLLIWRKRLSIQNSYDIGPAIIMLLGKYRTNNRNIFFALQETVGSLPNSPIQRAMTRLLIRLQRRVAEEETFAARQHFNNQTGTTWALQLSSIILEAAEGVNVESTLEELVDDIRHIQDALKDEKTNRLDTLFIGLTALLSLPGGLILMDLFVTRTTFQLQFATAQGVFDFVLALAFSLISFLVAWIFYRPKQDI